MCNREPQNTCASMSNFQGSNKHEVHVQWFNNKCSMMLTANWFVVRTKKINQLTFLDNALLKDVSAILDMNLQCIDHERRWKWTFSFNKFSFVRKCCFLPFFIKFTIRVWLSRALIEYVSKWRIRRVFVCFWERNKNIQ